MSSDVSSASASSGDATVPLPPLPPAKDSSLDETGARPQPLLRMDTFLAFLVVLLAFFLASSPSRTSDFWRHLAAGRGLLEGQYQFGIDPFSYTADGRSWVNHSWLFDLAAYGIYIAAGGAVLLFLKALLMAGLGVVLIACGRVGKNLTIPAIAAAIALIALGPWMSLRPITVSYLFLGLTIWLLEKGTGRIGMSGKSAGLHDVLKCYWPLLLLFAVWVNVDRWFLLGPLTTGLYFLGKFLNPAERPVLSRAAILVPALGLAACLFNPHLAGAIRLPAEWWASANAAQMQGDFALTAQLVKPHWHMYFSLADLPTAAGLAYWFLAVGGLLSFLLGWRRFEAWRLLVFLAMLAMSLVQGQAIAFFAVVAGPILSLNIGGMLASSAIQIRPESTWAGLVPGGRLIVGLLGLVAVAAAWTGWLVGAPYGPRRWEVAGNSSLEQAARQLNSWRQQDILSPADNGFAFSLEAANALAWLCPAEKCFLDSRLQVAPERIAEFIAIRKGLMQVGNPKAAADDWRAILRKNNINHIVLYSQNRPYQEAAFRALLSTPDEWPLLFFGDGAAIFGWRDPSKPAARDAFADLEVTFEQLAFDPAPSELPPATWSGLDPRPYYWWDAFWKNQPPPSPDLAEADLALVAHESLKPVFAKRNQRAWSAIRSADIVARSGQILPPLEEISPALSGLRTYAFYMGTDESSRAPLFIAVRALRRAIHKDQFESARAYFLLGEVYHRFANSSERKWAAQYTMLPRLRTVQSIYGYSQAVVLDPDNDVAHGRLGAIYVSMNYKDLAVKHYKEVMRLQRARGPESGESRDEHAQRLAKLQKRLDASDAELAEAQQKLDLRHDSLKVAERAEMALSSGLAGKALEILLKSDYAAFGNAGMALELKLLLATGAMEKVRAWSEPGQERFLNPFTYHWNLVQAAAATGDYDEADVNLLAAVAKYPGLTKEALPMRQAAAFVIGAAALDACEGLFPKFRPPILTNEDPGMTSYIPDLSTAPLILRLMASRLTDEAEINTTRGLLAVEAGRMDRADKCFGDAVAYFASPLHAMGEHGTRSGPYLADEMAAMITRGKRHDQKRR
ncbi:MAG: hypothetical protein FJ271_14370 [Planctomycetes bacterium]|nr:hypothetical protein [Planctomycetota bacterium]